MHTINPLEVNRELFINSYNRNINRDGSIELLEFLKNSDFFTAPASTRFHGSYEGGLVAHSLNVFESLRDLIGLYCLNGKYSDETIAIVSLLHDITKVNFYKRDTRNVKENGRWTTKEVYTIDDKFPCGHGEKSVIMIMKYMKLTDDEILAIRSHMGAFDESVKGGARFISQAFDMSDLAVLLHMADMVATHFFDK